MAASVPSTKPWLSRSSARARRKALRARGGNEIEFSDFEEDAATIEIEGFGDVSCRGGRLEALRLTGGGLLGVDFSECPVVDAELELSGLGEVELKLAGGDIRGEIDRNISLTHEGPFRSKTLRILEPAW